MHTTVVPSHYDMITYILSPDLSQKIALNEALILWKGYLCKLREVKLHEVKL